VAITTTLVEPPPSVRRPTTASVLAAVATLLCVTALCVVLGFWWSSLLGGDGETPASTAADTLPGTVSEPATPAMPFATTIPATTLASNDVDTAGTLDDETETTAESEPADADTDTGSPDADSTQVSLPTTLLADDAAPTEVEIPESKAVVRGGQIFLEGAVPTAEAGAEIEALAVEILGEGNVFNDYVVDARAGDPNLGNITVEDTINFEPDSAVILPDGEGLLNQGLALMTIRPAMTITIVGHTDSRGSDEVNRLLSEQRAESVKQWFVDRGIDPSRLTTRGAGETEPIADNATQDGRRLNRRIQFFLENILGEA
jgi:OOP family OmpA-OmpF porin